MIDLNRFSKILEGDIIKVPKTNEMSARLDEFKRIAKSKSVEIIFEQE